MNTALPAKHPPSVAVTTKPIPKTTTLKAGLFQFETEFAYFSGETGNPTLHETHGIQLPSS